MPYQQMEGDLEKDIFGYQSAFLREGWYTTYGRFDDIINAQKGKDIDLDRKIINLSQEIQQKKDQTTLYKQPKDSSAINQKLDQILTPTQGNSK
ncbi:unnamed protein product [Paramecium octaurelia]|uniref:Uncharacterized protein n=1 Tax=Paramecium octaurelia TaxID=43137 RepID=A0A8S1Y1N7_PAROT|nr:unnamed protein product [Paramecium octaurelia]